MVKDRLVIVLSASTYVFDLLKGFSVEQHIKTIPNPRGACAISSSDNMPLLATLSSEEGSVTVYNYYTKKANPIKAFTSGIQHIAISLDVCYIYIITARDFYSVSLMSQEV